MGDLKQYDETIWDRFFDFITPDVERLTNDEIDAEIQSANIDLSTARTRVSEALKAAKASQRFQTAHINRKMITAKLSSIVLQPIDNARDILHDMISNNISKSLQSTYFRKLEKTASDADIKSLLEDIHRLDHFDLGTIKDES